MRKFGLVWGLLLALGACAADMDTAVDPIDGDGSALVVTAPELAGVLEVANESSFEVLDVDVRLDRRAARNIVDQRGDGFTTMEALDAVPYVGEVALTRLLEYAYAQDLVDETIIVHHIPEGSLEAIGVLRVANELDFVTLDDAVGLDRRAAQNIVDDRGTGFESLTALDAVSYVGERAFNRLLAYASANGYVVDQPAEDAVDFLSDEYCSSGSGTSYAYTVISNAPEARTDVRLTLRFRDESPYGPGSHGISVQVGATEWENVASTTPSSSAWQTQSFNVPAATANRGIDAMGWLRFRVEPHTGYRACSQLAVIYNCPSCLACPAGEVDEGFGCQPISDEFAFTAIDHSRGYCGSASRVVEYQMTPEATGDGQLRFDYLVCEGGSVRMEIFTQNAGWISIGNNNTSNSCGYNSVSLSIPEAYLDQARDDTGRIQVRYRMNDNCRPGIGCAYSNDPCFRRARLSYPR